ncbi:MAG: terminase small subunit [Nanoarchaeota archaeon]|nr:terminase small subunit [Nanoarchaeota archaeon]
MKKKEDLNILQSKKNKKPAKKKLTPKQAMFCKEYLIDLNATQAAIRAGYSKKTADKIGHENLVKPDIKSKIDDELSKRSKRIEITAEKVLQEIAKMSFANMDDYITHTEDGEAFVDLSKLTRDQAAALTEVSVDSYFDSKRVVKKTKIKLADKKANLQLLGQHLNLFEEKEQKPVEIHINYGHRRKPDEEEENET